MKTDKTHKQNGSALILVIVVTVLLAVIGVMFLMVTRVSEMESAIVGTNKDLDAAVDTVVTRINDVLVEDLFGKTRATNVDLFQLQNEMVNAEDSFSGTYDLLNIYADESYDYPMHNSDRDPGPDTIQYTTDDAPYMAGLDGTYETADDLPIPGNLDDYWLASLEPVFMGVGPDATYGTADDIYNWPHITDLWGTLQVQPYSLLSQSYYTVGTPSFWVDPDIDTDATQWAVGAGVWNFYQVSANDVRAKVIGPKDRMKVIQQGAPANVTEWDNPANTNPFGARADADGDGVADSRWVQVPNMTTSRGKPVYAAIRIIDNCAMLNLNAAQWFYQEPHDSASPLFEDASNNPVSPFAKPWFEDKKDYDDFSAAYGGAGGFDGAKKYLYHKNHVSGSGRYSTEINYMPFLRGFDLNGDFLGSGGDDWYNLMIARGLYTEVLGTIYSYSPRETYDVAQKIENAGFAYSFFDISNELEIRNRYMLTSAAETVFEHSDVANFTLDSGGGVYSALWAPRDYSGNTIDLWYRRVNPDNFNAWDMLGNPIPDPASSDPDLRYTYDRRHVCTFYSYDRIIKNKGAYPLLTYDFNLLGLAANQIEEAEKIFLPKGPVTTDIAYGIFNGTTGRWESNYNNIETRRRIIHLLFALRAYYLLEIDPNYETMDFSSMTAAEQTKLNTDLRDAALKAAQIVANMIDYADDDAVNPTTVDRQGPFYDDGSAGTVDYGAQANADCTFITEKIIQDMIVELSGGLITSGSIPFGFNTTDIVFGYERQPFITEVYAKRNTSSGALEGFAIELINPYSDNLPLYRADGGFAANEDAWRIKVKGSAGINAVIAGGATTIGGYDSGTDTYGRYVIRSNSAVTLGTGYVAKTYELAALSNMGSGNFEIQLLRPAPKWVRDNLSINYIVVDTVEESVVKSLWVSPLYGENAVKRVDTDWQFMYADDTLYELQDNASYTNTLGLPTGVTAASITGLPDGFQMGALDDGLPLSRMHDLEVLAWYGNAPEDDPNNTITKKLFDAAGGSYFDLTGTSAGLLDYISTINRPEQGTLPGRININTAPVHVIAAAIPPTLADPNAAYPADPNKIVTFSSLDLAQAIVNRRNTNGPYKKLTDLLNVTGFKQYDGTGAWGTENVGTQSIEDDIEEEHWILSNLANKFTVRSDVFTAYILVRLGEDGPQRRMIAIFDRSNVWDKNDRPKLVALHPVPDPR